MAKTVKQINNAIKLNKRKTANLDKQLKAAKGAGAKLVKDLTAAKKREAAAKPKGKKKPKGKAKKRRR
jgi:hypothetical protein